MNKEGATKRARRARHVLGPDGIRRALRGAGEVGILDALPIRVKSTSICLPDELGQLVHFAAPPPGKATVA